MQDIALLPPHDILGPTEILQKGDLFVCNGSFDVSDPVFEGHKVYFDHTKTCYYYVRPQGSPLPTAKEKLKELIYKLATLARREKVYNCDFLEIYDEILTIVEETLK